MEISVKKLLEKRLKKLQDYSLDEMLEELHQDFQAKFILEFQDELLIDFFE